MCVCVCVCECVCVCVMRTARSHLDRVQRIGSRAMDLQPISSSLTSLQWGVSVGTPWLLEEDMGRSPLSEYMSLHLSLK